MQRAGVQTKVVNDREVKCVIEQFGNELVVEQLPRPRGWQRLESSGTA
jgi:hypothetical protein